MSVASSSPSPESGRPSPYEDSNGEEQRRLDNVSPRAESDPYLKEQGGFRQPSALSGAALYLSTLVVFIAVGTVMLKYGLRGLILSQIVCLLGPSLLYLRIFRLPPILAISPQRPTALQLLGALLLGAGGWFVLVTTVLRLQEKFYPTPESYLEDRLAFLFAGSGPWHSLLLFVGAALTPAVCEEVFFRGVLLNSFRRVLKDGAAIAIVALLFAAFHFNPYQLSVTFILGLVLGFLRVRTKSLVPSIVFHLSNNALVLTVAESGQETLPTPYSVALLLAFAAGVTALTIALMRQPLERSSSH